MNDHELELLSDEEKIKLLETEQDDQKRAFIVRALSSDELKLKYIQLILEDVNKSSVTYTMSDENNKVKIIDMMLDEKWITSAVVEMKTDKLKIKYLNNIKNSYYKNCILESLKVSNEELSECIELVDNEDTKTLIIAKIPDLETRRSYLESFKDINCRSRIIMTLDDEELKKEYIEQVTDEGTRTLLIASLKDKDVRNQMLGINNSKYHNLSLPDGMTIGMEIECEGINSSYGYSIDKIIPGWKGKRDGSLEDGVEVVSPILTNSESDTKDIYTVCKALKNIGQESTERCGGHIHIGANYLKSKEAFANLIELWSNNEEIFFLLSNKEGEITRESVATYAPPLSKKIKEEIDSNRFVDFDSLSKEEFIEIIKSIKANAENRETRRASINFDNINSEDKNTIEFRLSNGTVDANTWIENANLFGGLIAISQRISEIQDKNPQEITEEEKVVLDKFSMLKGKDISTEDRLSMLLDLCVPEDMKQVFIERYNENSQLMEQNNKIKDGLHSFISEEPVVFPIGTQLGTSLKNIAFAERASTVKGGVGEIRDGVQELETPTRADDSDISLDD